MIYDNNFHLEGLFFERSTNYMNWLTTDYLEVEGDTAIKKKLKGKL